MIGRAISILIIHSLDSIHVMEESITPSHLGGEDKKGKGRRQMDEYAKILSAIIPVGKHHEVQYRSL